VDDRVKMCSGKYSGWLGWGWLGWGLFAALVAIASPTVAAPATAKGKPAAPSLLINLPVDRITEGQNYLKRGWADAAIEVFTNELRINPQSVPATLGLAQAHQKNGQLEKAWEFYRQVVAIAPSNEVALRELGVFGEYRSEWQEAGVVALDALLKMQPRDAAALSQRALLLGFQGKFEAAWADYELIDLANLPVKNRLKAAEVAGFSGRSAVAVELYDRVLPLLNDDVVAQLDAQVYRAYFGRRAERVTEAEAKQVLTRWVAANPDRVTAAIADLAGTLPIDQDLADLYSRVQREFPQQLAVQQRALMLQAKADPAAAKAGAMALVEANPDEAYAYFIHADVARATGDLPAAVAAYEALVQRQPNNLDGRISLGGAYFEQRRDRLAMAQFQQVLQLDSQNVLARRILADLHVTRDQPLLALKLLNEVVDIQRSQGVRDPQVRDRIADIELGALRRRSFQTPWEGYSPLVLRQ
jgi:tetratricopeptide (TPR) repeat protein